MISNFKHSILACAFAGLTACGGNAPTSEIANAAVSYTDRNNNGVMDDFENPALDVSLRATDLITRLSLAQKVNLLTGTGFQLNNVGGSEKVPGAAGSTFAIPELGIPAMVLADGPAGLRISPTRENDPASYFATAFPIATALASTWNTQLVTQVGDAMGEEVKEYGVDLFLAPGMNIHANPLAGRNFEYYSEDPLISGSMAASIVNGVEAHGVGTTIKHFVANNAETSRMWLDAHINEQAYREIYLRGFEIAIEASQPWAIMTSYNKVNGVYTSQDEVLLEAVLRQEFGYEGLVMTDWFAGDSAVAQMQAGNDLIMPGMPDQRQAITDAVKSGSLNESVLDRNLQRIVETILKSPSYNGYAYSNKPDLQAHANVARQAAAEGVVLLKNKNALPVNADTRIAAFGNTSYDFIAGGTGSGDVNEAYTVSLVDGLNNANIPVFSPLQQAYTAFMAEEAAKRPPKKHFFELQAPLPEFSLPDALLNETVANTDVGLITIGRNAGEFQDRQLDDDFNLTAAELTMIAKVSDAYHKAGKKVVAVLNTGGVIEVASWRDQVDAIVLPWQGGQEAGNALVDVLTGKVNPSGRLATTFPLTYANNPTSDVFPGKPTSDETVTDPYIGLFVGKRTQLDYVDGIYVGYRYYDTFNVPVAYDFGYGLSYTGFDIEGVSVSSAGSPAEFTITLSVSNTGDVTGKDVIQVYASAPTGDIPKANKILVAFAKTGDISPASTEDLTLHVNAKRLASFSETQRAWVVEAGDYTFHVGHSSQDIIKQVTVSIPQSIVVSKVLAELVPPVSVAEISPK
ncbi:beta-glucosidase [Alteromonas sp. AMM-1]|uniref:beta-glucosidase family protein n=1 Tax=Alteromonas sp. AMM-1 TaxID=3394233 RepID=UPI0039A4628B